MNAPIRYPFTASDTSVSIFFTGKMYSIPSTEPAFEPLVAYLKSVPDGEPHSFTTIEALVDKPKLIERVTEGMVEVLGSTVYYAGAPLHSALAFKLVQMIEAGYDAKPWARFLDRVMANPSERSRQCLYSFLDVWKAPITEDGHFIAFKRVRHDYRDIHSGKFDNSPGTVVTMPREGVNPDPDIPCSAGLHVCATSYLGHFYSSIEGYRVVAVKVDPADVVAVPSDYGFAKMRVCQYLVLGDAEESFYANAEDVPFYDSGTEPAGDDYDDFDDGFDDDDFYPPEYDYNYDDYDDFDDFDDDDDDFDDDDDDGFDDGFDDDGFYPSEYDDDFDPWEEEEDIDGDDPHGTYTTVAEEAAKYATRSESENGSRGAYDAARLDRWLDEACAHMVAPRTDVKDAEDPLPTQIQFRRNQITFTPKMIIEGIKEYGQRGYSRITGIPRTTLQDWLSKIGN